MKILIIGSGGREHALAWRGVHEGHQVLCAPGSAGMAADGVGFRRGSAPFGGAPAPAGRGWRLRLAAGVGCAAPREHALPGFVWRGDLGAVLAAAEEDPAGMVPRAEGFAVWRACHYIS